MALQYFSTSGWATFTAGVSVVPNSRILRFRDTALAISGGAATLSPIYLPAPAWAAKAHVVEGDGTLTAGTGTFQPLAFGVTYAAGRKPTLPNDDTGSISFNIATNANEMGEWAGAVSSAFEVVFSGITGTSTTLHVEVELHLV